MAVISSFTPSETYRNLTQQQLLTFQGQPFHPTFVVEVERCFCRPKIEEAMEGAETEYFPAGIQLALLVDLVSKNAFVFERHR